MILEVIIKLQDNEIFVTKIIKNKDKTITQYQRFHIFDIG